MSRVWPMKFFPVHIKLPTVLGILLAAGSVAGLLVHASDEAAAAADPRTLSGGETTVFDTSRNAFTFAARNLPAERRAQFFTGNSFFNENWVAAPASTSARDGLGPIFIARSCSACHFKDGRDRGPQAGVPAQTLVVRLSLPGKDVKTGAPVPEPVYGGQLQMRAVPGVPGEAEVLVDWEEIPGNYGDGDNYSLRRPRYSVTNAAYGALSREARLSMRVAPVVIGLGLLEAVTEETLLGLADEEDRNRDGISGRLNRVWDVAGNKKVAGRFGWKAEQPSVRQQVAGAFNEDMGLTTSMFAHENHTATQTNLAVLPSGGSPEVKDEMLEAVVLYSRTLAVPARREVTHLVVQRGESLFRNIGCADCHQPVLQTGTQVDLAELANQTIQPFTDLLLHDMGEGLADGREVFEASGREWRTPPLWGIGLVKTVNGHTDFLHDGRARNLAEAILWHGGEAEHARERFRVLPKEEREALLRFLGSL
ncbi:MAG TPA: di-heme oxidoredictase family protein [Verrucomicrobiae bacterium]